MLHHKAARLCQAIAQKLLLGLGPSGRQTNWLDRIPPTDDKEMQIDYNYRDRRGVCNSEESYAFNAQVFGHSTLIFISTPSALESFH